MNIEVQGYGTTSMPIELANKLAVKIWDALQGSPFHNEAVVTVSRTETQDGNRMMRPFLRIYADANAGEAVSALVTHLREKVPVLATLDIEVVSLMSFYSRLMTAGKKH